MKPACQRLLDYMQRGHEVTPLTSIQRLGISALSQRIGDLRREGFDIRDRWIDDGKSRYKAYYVEAPKKAAPKDETLVRAHVRRLLRDEPVDEQPGLFA